MCIILLLQGDQENRGKFATAAKYVRPFQNMNVNTKRFSNVQGWHAERMQTRYICNSNIPTKHHVKVITLSPGSTVFQKPQECCIIAEGRAQGDYATSQVVSKRRRASAIGNNRLKLWGLGTCAALDSDQSDSCCRAGSIEEINTSPLHHVYKLKSPRPFASAAAYCI